MSNWVHLRNWPFIIKKLVKNFDDPAICLGLKLHEIVERLTAHEYLPYEVDILENKLVEYLDERKSIRCIFPNLMPKPKPKHHFLSHYGRTIRMFGPPMCYWTGRFESKHRVAKMLAESAKNVINITQTVSVRQQMRVVSVYYHGIFDFKPFKLPEDVKSKKEISQDTEFYNNLKTFMNDSDLICRSVIVNNQEYKNGDIIVVDITDSDNVNVGLIQTILIKEDKVYFVIKKYQAIRNMLQYFENEKPSDAISEFVESTKLADFKPLIKRGTAEKFVFMFHHNVSFDYQ